MQLEHRAGRGCGRSVGTRCGDGPEHERDRKHIGHRPQRMQRLGVRHVAGHQQHRGLRRQALHGGFQQPGGETRVIGRQAGGRRARVQRNVPVAGGGVVHRVREARGRHQPLGPRQCFAQQVAVAGVAGGTGEHGGQLRGVQAGGRHRLLGDHDGSLDDGAGTAAFGGRQQLRRRHRRGCRHVTQAQQRSALRPINQPRAQQAHAQQLHFHRAAPARWPSERPSTRQALLPPKPKELLATTCSGPWRGCSK